MPPQPLEVLLERADLIVEAEVSSVEETAELDETPAQDRRAEGHTGGASPAGAQRVMLRVLKLLKGELKGHAPSETALVEARKPEAGYLLQPGNRGAFFLCREDGGWQIDGRYGPDSHPLDRVVAAIAKLR